MKEFLLDAPIRKLTNALKTLMTQDGKTEMKTGIIAKILSPISKALKYVNKVLNIAVKPINKFFGEILGLLGLKVSIESETSKSFDSKVAKLDKKANEGLEKIKYAISSIKPKEEGDKETIKGTSLTDNKIKNHFAENKDALSNIREQVSLVSMSNLYSNKLQSFNKIEQIVNIGMKLAENNIIFDKSDVMRVKNGLEDMKREFNNETFLYKSMKSFEFTPDIEYANNEINIYKIKIENDNFYSETKINAEIGINSATKIPTIGLGIDGYFGYKITDTSMININYSNKEKDLRGMYIYQIKRNADIKLEFNESMVYLQISVGL
ncbi:MAG: hypothetical protein LBF97_00350 [Elusimicrobiota bacterium]|nr:hypothetical protein [Elusimicrobiota bacterium]